MMPKEMTPSEQFVYQICTKSFLSLWSYPNPQTNKPGKELCDVLVVCDPDILIFSVKEVEITENENIAINWDRWHRKAIEASIKQIYGAERWLTKATSVIQKDGTQGLPLPDISERRIYRIAVALGSQGKVPIMYGDFGKGFVHVFDEITFNIVLSELDTITDFITYLLDKERFHESGIETFFEGTEEDLLAFYLHNGRCFPSGYDHLLVGSDLWEDFIKKKQYIMKKVEDRVSYIWDGLIEIISKNILGDTLIPGSNISQAELVVRIMARENRFHRRLLSQSYDEFLKLSGKKKIESRYVQSPSGIVYVFLASPLGEDREYRSQKLSLRCFVARGLHPKNEIVVGIATEQYKPNQGFSLDIFYLQKKDWSQDDQKSIEGIQRELGYFQNPQIQSTQHDEYPIP